MPTPKYLHLALPTSIVRDNHCDSAFEAVATTVGKEHGTTYRFPIPDFKIGTLDALVLQADELAKMDANVEGSVVKVVDVLRGTVGNDEVERHKTVNDSESFFGLSFGEEAEGRALGM
jgi:V-type H+-transporting ATPase subunit C